MYMYIHIYLESRVPIDAFQRQTVLLERITVNPVDINFTLEIQYQIYITCYVPLG